ncbi:hypothetical protein FRC12_009483 [Ceratobasidium sp. 428]|nr:hypothetical protein FRC12_009483 [Ceratobasidium sp. 428]
MVIANDIQRLGRRSRGLIRCISRIGRIGTHRRQSITLIQICEELERHLDLKNQDGIYDEVIMSIVYKTSDILNAIAGSGPKGYNIDQNIGDCVDEIEAYRDSHLICPGGSNCTLGGHDYRFRMEEAGKDDKTRETWVGGLKKDLKKPAPEPKKPISLMFHTLWEQPTVFSCDLEQSTSLPHLMYMFSKGLKLGRQISLSQNPRVYHGFKFPYNAVDCFSMEETGADSVPRKSPEVDLTVFKLKGNQKCETIHVYYDEHPLVILEDALNKRAFSLVGWGKKFSPTGMVRGQNGALYSTDHLQSLVSYNHTDDGTSTDVNFGLLPGLSTAYESAFNHRFRLPPSQVTPKDSYTRISYIWTTGGQNGFLKVVVQAPAISALPTVTGNVEPARGSAILQVDTPETVLDRGNGSNDTASDAAIDIVGDAANDAANNTITNTANNVASDVANDVANDAANDPVNDAAENDAASDITVFYEAQSDLRTLEVNTSSNPEEVTSDPEPRVDYNPEPGDNQESHNEPITVETGQSEDSTIDGSQEQQAPVDAESPRDAALDATDTIEMLVENAMSNSLPEIPAASQVNYPSETPERNIVPVPPKKKRWFGWLRYN